MSEITDKGLSNLHSYMLRKYGHIATDKLTRYENIINHGYESLCDRCDGTGNQLMSMYQKCVNCDGNGLATPPNKKEEL